MSETTTSSALHDLPLQDQTSLLSAQIRRTPADAKLRVHLAQLSMVLGAWERAVTQLQAAAQLDAAAIPMAQAYREAIRCERIRERVFAGELRAPTLGEPLPWQELLAQALVARGKGEQAAAADLQAQAYEAASPTPLRLNGEHDLAWLADADSRLGPTCEVLLNGNYYWLPFERVQHLELEAPQDLRDLVWIPGRLTLTDGAEHVVLVPSRYPLSHAQGNDRLSLSALTEWQDLGEDSWGGLGQRCLVSDQDEHALLSIRSLESLAVPPEPAP
ncbi:MAG: type VI secretion system accessory protein TagJ [Pseudomonas sp.]|uniref:type VI secretion system accessory protein TagJ n=1 Tax=Pseudomonas sp. TaxID=306 RepID=UPI003393D72B